MAGIPKAVQAGIEDFSEAERIIRVVGAGLGMSSARDEPMLLRKGDCGKMICAAIAKSHAAVGNDWLAECLATGHGSYVSSLVNRIRRNKKEQKTLEKHEKIWKI